MIYINLKGCYGVETVDQFDTRKEAKDMLYEYNMSDPANIYYISQRPVNDWYKN